MLGAVTRELQCDTLHQRVGRFGRGQQSENGEQNLGDGERGAPVVAQAVTLEEKIQQTKQSDVENRIL